MILIILPYIKAACQCLSLFCRNNTDMLLHFSVPMARAVLNPLVNKVKYKIPNKKFNWKLKKCEFRTQK
jgi:hypothetical protein